MGMVPNRTPPAVEYLTSAVEGTFTGGKGTGPDPPLDTW